MTAIWDDTSPFFRKQRAEEIFWKGQKMLAIFANPSLDANLGTPGVRHSNFSCWLDRRAFEDIKENDKIQIGDLDFQVKGIFIGARFKRLDLSPL
jgi:hypothetical protein